MKCGPSRRRTAGLSTPLRSGRDDNVAWKQCLAFPNKIVISTGEVMGLRLTQGNEKPRSGIHALWNRYPFLVIPTGAEGPAVPQTLPGDVFRQSVPGFPATLRWTRPRVRLSPEGKP